MYLDAPENALAIQCIFYFMQLCIFRSYEIDINVSVFVFPEKEVQTTKNYELEIAALKEQVDELKAKNEILDDALTNAQANVVHLEKEVRIIYDFNQ